MEKLKLEIKSNRQLNAGIYEMTLSGGIEASAGQFIEFALDGFYLRRPISVCDCEDGTLTLVYKVVGEGTKKMSELELGAKADVLMPLGNGFNLDPSTAPLLIGGGIGCAPLYKLAKGFKRKGIAPTIILGFRNQSEIFYEEEFSKLGNVIIATDDGSRGFKGNALAAAKAAGVMFDRYFACGPAVMLKYVKQFSAQGQMSLEARMGCGFGACMGCSIVTTEGYKRVCKEGPVFDASEIIFD